MGKASNIIPDVDKHVATAHATCASAGKDLNSIHHILLAPSLTEGQIRTAQLVLDKVLDQCNVAEKAAQDADNAMEVMVQTLQACAELHKASGRRKEAAQAIDTACAAARKCSQDSHDVLQWVQQLRTYYTAHIQRLESEPPPHATPDPASPGPSANQPCADQDPEMEAAVCELLHIAGRGKGKRATHPSPSSSPEKEVGTSAEGQRPKRAAVASVQSYKESYKEMGFHGWSRSCTWTWQPCTMQRCTLSLCHCSHTRSSCTPAPTFKCSTTA